MQAAQAKTSNTHRNIGLAIAILGGLAIVPLSDLVGALSGHSGGAGFVSAVIVSALVAGVSAWFLRTWWSLLVVAAVFLVGYLVGGMVDAGVQGSLYNAGYAFQYLTLALIAYPFSYLLPVLVGAAIGTSIGKRRS